VTVPGTALQTVVTAAIVGAFMTFIFVVFIFIFIFLTLVLFHISGVSVLVMAFYAWFR
jgi:hypothetical protein